MTANILTQSELKAQLHYEPETGIFTRLASTSTRVKVGDIAGGKNSEGYIGIKVNNKLYQAHRLAWLYVNGEFPVNCIDHINGVRDDNRIINLRQATNQQNMLNAGVRKNNKSGYKGVTFHKPNNQWRAVCLFNGIRHHLGLFKNPELASEAYQAFARLHHGEFYKAS